MKKIIALIIAVTMLLALNVFTTSAQNIERTQNVQSINLVLEVNCESVYGEICCSAQLQDGSFISVGSVGFDDPYENYYNELRTPGDLKGTATVIKYTPDGNVDFVRTFGGNDADRFNTVLFNLTDGEEITIDDVIEMLRIIVAN